jgi:putative pyruvate formate lyase activating enzyme
MGWCAIPGDAPVISAICRHFGEEPVLGGASGVVNVFFTHCNLACIYCQNMEISNRLLPIPPAVPVDEAVRRIQEMLEQGARAVGFVSPSHQVRACQAIIRLLRSRGARAPIIYNSSGYDSVASLRALEGDIDIWLPDYKYADPDLALKLSSCADYPVQAMRAILEMRRQAGTTLELDDDGLAARGLIIRHLVLPGHIANSRSCLEAIAENISTRVYISLMAQYHPRAGLEAPLDRTLQPSEYAEIVAYFYALGFSHGFVQELISHDSFLPDFSRGENAFGTAGE